jgi:hypothetical protein
MEEFTFHRWFWAIIWLSVQHMPSERLGMQPLWPLTPTLFFFFLVRRINKSSGPSRQDGFTDRESALSLQSGFLFPHSLALVALSVGSFLLRNCHKTVAIVETTFRFYDIMPNSRKFFFAWGLIRRSLHCYLLSYPLTAHLHRHHQIGHLQSPHRRENDGTGGGIQLHLYLRRGDGLQPIQ